MRTVLFVALALALLAGGCACALPHDDVKVLADDAERLSRLWELEHSPTGLTPGELEETRALVGRVKARAATAREGLGAEGKGKAIQAAEVERGGLK